MFLFNNLYLFPPFIAVVLFSLFVLLLSDFIGDALRLFIFCFVCCRPFVLPVLDYLFLVMLCLEVLIIISHTMLGV